MAHKIALKSIIAMMMVVCGTVTANAAENENELNPAVEEAQVINLNATPGDTVTVDLPAGRTLLEERAFCSQFFNQNPDKVLKQENYLTIVVTSDTIVDGHRAATGDTLVFSLMVSLRDNKMVPRRHMTRHIQVKRYVDQKLPDYAASYGSAQPAQVVNQRRHSAVTANNGARGYQLRDYTSLSQAEKEAIASGKLHAYDPQQVSATGRPLTNFYLGIAGGGSYMMKSNFLAPEGDILVGYEFGKLFVEGQLALTRSEFPDSSEVQGNYTACAMRVAGGVKLWQSVDYNSSVSVVAEAGGEYQKSDRSGSSYVSRNLGATFGGGVRASFGIARNWNLGGEAGYVVRPWVNHFRGHQDYGYGGPYARVLLTYSLGAH